MAQRSRENLKAKFSDGERPSGDDFRDLLDSYLSKEDDRIDVDGDDNLDIPGGLNIKDTSEGEEGTLRFRSGQLQINDGTEWTTLGEGGGVFTAVGGGPNVAFGEGHVGIGDFTEEAPAYKLEVDLDNNNGPENQVRFGNTVIANGRGTASNDVAQFSHYNHDRNDSYALRQGPDGDVVLNAPENTTITIVQGGNTPIISISGEGNVSINGNVSIEGDLEITGDLVES